MLDCNLHRSLWSSCMDVPVPESEPRSGGWGRGGRGASCGLHFLWRENPVRLSQERNLKALSQCCLLFVHQVLLAEGNTVSFLEAGSLWNISQNLLRIYLPNSPCVMDHSCWSESALWISIRFYYWTSCLPASCSNVLSLLLSVYMGSWPFVQQLPADGECSLFSGLWYT